MKATKKGDFGPRPIPAAGLTPCRCISVIDLGTQVTEYQGQKKSAHKAKITWELPDLMHVFDEKKGMEPFVISEDFTVSTHPKSRLRGVLEQWMGRNMTPQEEEEFDLFKIVNMPGFMNVVHNKSKDGKAVYANLGSIAKPPAGIKVKPAINPLVKFEIGAANQNEVFAKLYPFVQKKIELSPEWMEQTHGKSAMSQDMGDVITEGNEEPGF